MNFNRKLIARLEGLRKRQLLNAKLALEDAAGKAKALAQRAKELNADSTAAIADERYPDMACLGETRLAVARMAIESDFLLKRTAGEVTAANQRLRGVEQLNKSLKQSTDLKCERRQEMEVQAYFGAGN